MAKNETETRIAHIPPFGLRMLPDLKTRIEAAAKANGRSLNSEITARLEWSLQAEEQAGGSMLATGATDAMSDMESRIKDACMKAIAEQFAFLETVIEAKAKNK